MRWLCICWLGLFIAHRTKWRMLPHALGLAAPAARALLFAFLVTSPMLLGPLLLGRLSSEIELPDLLFSAAVWPLAEEILFRGYAFGQLHREGGLGLWSAAILTGAIFGVLHLSQASVQQLPLSGEIGTVLLISVGGILFAWLYTRWNFNLWVPFGLHLFMNLWWSVFDMAENPLGGWVPNLLRGLTVGLAIILTLFRDRLRVFVPGMAEQKETSQAHSGE